MNTYIFLVIYNLIFFSAVTKANAGWLGDSIERAKFNQMTNYQRDDYMRNNRSFDPSYNLDYEKYQIDDINTKLNTRKNISPSPTTTAQSNESCIQGDCVNDTGRVINSSTEATFQGRFKKGAGGVIALTAKEARVMAICKKWYPGLISFGTTDGFLIICKDKINSIKYTVSESNNIEHKQHNKNKNLLDNNSGKKNSEKRSSTFVIRGIRYRMDVRDGEPEIRE